jgi:hypothetical protein
VPIFDRLNRTLDDLRKTVLRTCNLPLTDCSLNYCGGLKFVAVYFPVVSTACQEWSEVAFPPPYDRNLYHLRKVNKKLTVSQTLGELDGVPSGVGRIIPLQSEPAKSASSAAAKWTPCVTYRLPGARFTNFQELFLTRILNAILNRIRIDS